MSDKIFMNTTIPPELHKWVLRYIKENKHLSLKKSDVMRLALYELMERNT